MCVCVSAVQTAVITDVLSLQILLIHVCSYATYVSVGEECLYQGVGGKGVSEEEASLGFNIEKPCFY